MKITKFKEDITSEIASSFKSSIAIDTEATGLQIPERDKLSLIQICDENGKRLAKRDDSKSIQKYRLEGFKPSEVRAMIGF